MQTNHPGEHTGYLTWLQAACRNLGEWGYVLSEHIARLSDTYCTSALLARPAAVSPKVEPVTVLFIDLRDFTSLVEDYAPAQVIQQLNQYFAEMTRIIEAHGGVLDKYIGDEIMAYFESDTPMAFSRSAYNAVSCAIEMVRRLEVLNAKWGQHNWPTLKCGIGINSGPVLKGHIGSAIKGQLTIIGDTVNVASRLQALTKQYHTPLLISGSTYKLVQGEFPITALGDIQIRGRRKTADVYHVDIATLLNLC